MQIQEDGLPVVLFGDIQFGNNDYWTHPMPTDERIEAIRGGTASTLASQAIGAVLNHISFTGRNDGGYVELEKAVNYDFTKVNFRFGTSINDTLYYNLGGYYDVGRGIEHAAYNVSNSYAIKGNITKELADDRGYIRFPVQGRRYAGTQLQRLHQFSVGQRQESHRHQRLPILRCPQGGPGLFRVEFQRAVRQCRRHPRQTAAERHPHD